MNKNKILYVTLSIITLLIFVILHVVLNDHSLKDLTAQRINQEVKFTDKLEICNNSHQDSITYFQRPYKILIYQDSIGCTGCMLGLGNWKIFDNLINSLVLDKVSVLLLLDRVPSRKASLLARQHEWDKPILLDLEGIMNKQYKFSENEIFNCMLLDSLNKIVLVGNPTKSKKIQDLYIKYLLGQKNK